MAAIVRLSLRTFAEHRSRYLLGSIAVAVAVAFMVAARLVTNALEDQLQAAGADQSGVSGSIFVLLSLFGLIVIVAAGFVISNSFQTMVSARTRELALLRTVGMRASQGFFAVTVEGFLLGLVGVVLGVILGTLAAWAVIQQAVEGARLVLPGVGVLVLAIVVGMGVTMAAVLVPARKATQVAPVAALSTAETLTGEPLSKARTVFGLVVLLAGLALALAPLGDSEVALFAFVIGALVSFAGMSLLAPAYVPFLARLIAVGSTSRPVGRMATGNLARGRRRTANSAMAVVLGITLFTGVNVVLSSGIAMAEADGYTQNNVGGIYLLAFGLTGLTVVVGLIGVLNTVVLSVRERARELALLRAVGMTTGEVRRTVTVEGSLIGFVGVVVGTVLGILGAAVLLTRLGASIPLAPDWSILAPAVIGTAAIVTATTYAVAGRAAASPPALATA